MFELVDYFKINSDFFILILNSFIIYFIYTTFHFLNIQKNH